MYGAYGRQIKREKKIEKIVNVVFSVVGIILFLIGSAIIMLPFVVPFLR